MGTKSSSPVTATRLLETNGRLITPSGELHCGDLITVCIGGVEIAGRVEYSRKDFAGYSGWYFTNNKSGFCPLVAGMLVRKDKS